MPRMIFVNLPVGDLQRSMAFYSALGAVNEPKFTDDTAACMMASETIGIMLLTHDKFRQFTSKSIPDARSTCQMLNCLSVDGRADVDTLAERAGRVGGRTDPSAPQDFGLMYSRSVEDPDGHVWELMWMDPAAAQQGASAFEAA